MYNVHNEHLPAQSNTTMYYLDFNLISYIKFKSFLLVKLPESQHLIP